MADLCLFLYSQLCSSRRTNLLYGPFIKRTFVLSGYVSTVFVCFFFSITAMKHVIYCLLIIYSSIQISSVTFLSPPSLAPCGRLSLSCLSDCGLWGDPCLFSLSRTTLLPSLLICSPGQCFRSSGHRPLFMVRNRLCLFFCLSPFTSQNLWQLRFIFPKNNLDVITPSSAAFNQLVLSTSTATSNSDQLIQLSRSGIPSWSRLILNQSFSLRS